MRAINQMTREEIVAAIHKLKMPGLADAFVDQCDNHKFLNMTFETRIGIMVKHELETRDHRRQKRLLKEAGLTYVPANPEDVLYGSDRGIVRAQLEELIECKWIVASQPPSLLITGATGTGKTWIAQMLGRCACRNSLSVAYYRFPQLLEAMDDAVLHRTSVSLRKRLAGRNLLIIDDFGLGQFSERTRSDFLSLIDERVGFASTIIVSQIPIKGWHEFIGEAYSADALADRLVHGSYHLHLTGPSMRERNRPHLGGDS